MSVLVGDCREVMAGMDAESVDVIVTDPPYEIAFMSRSWDRRGVAFDPATWREALRVLKPGGHLLAFGAPRTYHRLAVAIEDAGFEVKDCLMWVFGSGFPKHRSLLKPGYEPLLMARKPGTGTLNIDACRIGTSKNVPASPCRTDSAIYGAGSSVTTGDTPGANPNIGRWPANLLLDEDAAALLDQMSGERKSNSGKPFRRNVAHQYEGGFVGNQDAPGYYGDTGGASRYFYVAKASRRERNAGLEGMPERKPPQEYRLGAVEGNPRKPAKCTASRPVQNPHPTVKPIALMRWLVRLVTPPGGLCLDPFAGSGSTGCAAALEGVRFLGIEEKPEYAEIARKRIAYWAEQGAQLALTGG